MLTPTGKRYGTHGSELHVDEHGRKYLVKTQEEFRTHLDVAVSQLQEALKLYAPLVTAQTVNGRFVAVHEWIDGSECFDHWRFDPFTVTVPKLARLTVECAFDWLISNHDSHPGQFIWTDYGLIGLDKGQAFKHLGKDKLSPDYHPNRSYGEAEPIYNHLKRGGFFVPSDRLDQLLADIEAMPEKEYLAIFAAYAETCPFIDANWFQDASLERKSSVGRDILNYIKD